MRIGKKSVYQGNTSETSYVVSGTQILSETKGSSTNYYIYDDKGLPIGIVYNGTTYTYRKNIQGDIIAILDSAGNEVVTYTYNAWGVATVGGTMASTLGAKNPFRYRGYYYDTETGYYYLNSRYYDPVTGRFLNADSFVSTGQGLLGYNMFAYCGNNPVNRVDRNGEFSEFIGNLINNIGNAIQSLAPAYAGCGGAAIVDGPIPIGDAIGFIGAAIITVGAIGIGIYDTVSYPDTIPQDDVDEKVKDKYRPPKLPTVIYRYGGTSPSNLTPDQKDVDLFPVTGKGLSFSLIPKRGCAVTTIEEINATGVLYAKPDGGTHVSVFPVGATLKQWHDAGSSSVWTQSLMSVVRVWGG